MNIQKHTLLIQPLVVTLLFMASCSDEYSGGLTATTSPHYLNADKSSLSFSADGGTLPIKIQSIGTSWSLANNADWLSLSETSGTTDGSVDITASANTEFSDKGRAASLILSGSAITNTRIITANQESPAIALVVTPANIELDAKDGSSADVQVNCNYSWNISVSDDSWLSAVKENDKVSITAKENATGASRINTISVSSGSKIETIKVTQKAANIILSPEVLSFGHAAGSKTISITSDVSWTTKTNTSWLDFTPKSGNAGTTSVNVTVTQNTSKDKRYGSFTIGEAEISVEQDGIILSASPSTLSFGEAGETLPLEITSNTSWKLSSTSSDIYLSQSEGEGNATISITMKENIGSARRDILTLETTDGSNQSLQIPVSQDGYGYIVINSLDPFAQEGGSIVYSVPALSNWQAEVPTEYSSWIHISPSKGSKDDPVTIIVDKNENTDVNNRNGYIILSYDDGAKYRINITQYGVGISTNITTYKFFAKGGDSEAIVVQSAGSITASSSSNWLTTRLNGNLLTISATENFTGEVRTGTVVLSLAGRDCKVVISITQASQYGDFIIDDYDEDKDMLSYTHIDGTFRDYYDEQLAVNTSIPKDVDLGHYITWTTFIGM